MSHEAAQQALARLLASGQTATGELDGDTFFLRLIPGNSSTEIKLRGRIVSDNDGTLVCASPCIPWDAIVVLPIATGIVIAIHPPIGLLALIIIFIFVGYAFHFTTGTRRGYDFLRKTYAA